MSSENDSNLDQVYNLIVNNLKDKVGIVDLNCIIIKSLIEDIKSFIKEEAIQIVETPEMNKLDYFKYICRYFYNQYNSDKQIRALYSDEISYIGDKMIRSKHFNNVLKINDFISKSELIDVFSDFCADLGISVFNTSEIKEYSLDLYFTKRKPILRTEAVFVRTGEEMTEENYKDTLKLISNASKVATWIVFCTTPLGATNVGLYRLIGDMDRLNTWLYIVDPHLKRILGIVKGSKSKDYEQEIRDDYIKKLPREPIRAPSQVVKFSKYNLENAESYKTSRFISFQILNEKEHEKIVKMPREEPKYDDIFKSLLITDKEAGLPMATFSSEMDTKEQMLVTGFLSAMDDFIKSISKSGEITLMKEIDYKGLFIQAVYGKMVKMVLFLSEPADQILRDRLVYFLKYFENMFESQITEFKSTGKTSVIDEEEIFPIVNKILDI
ncbi:MAG: hypothetical protein EU539_12205 [Promethearchaeota archaeon]|nr:MAG: hypothetical protein EU539_12205 [Candidatus Lokiarchaeota archaeon]